MSFIADTADTADTAYCPNAFRVSAKENHADTADTAYCPNAFRVSAKENHADTRGATNPMRWSMALVASWRLLWQFHLPPLCDQADALDFSRQ